MDSLFESLATPDQPPYSILGAVSFGLGDSHDSKTAINVMLNNFFIFFGFILIKSQYNKTL
jgi:hypothetical protein